MSGEVRQAVHAEWLAVVAQRRQRRRVMAYGIAASVAVAAIGLVVGLRFMSAASASIATVTRVEGALQVDRTHDGTWRSVTVGDRLTGGDLLRTGQDARAALTLASGVSVRMDAGSSIQLAATDRVVLDQGALYVDTRPVGAPTSGAAAEPVAAQSLVVETSYGSVRHLGTQYQVRTAQGAMEIGVREGRVEVMNTSGTHQGVAGELLVIRSEGSVSRSAISAHDPSWHWVQRVAPPFDIDRQPLTDFLGWIERETGKQVVYATPQVRQGAAQMILRGSVDNLTPEQALAAVLATTSFRHTEDAGTIRIQQP